MTTKHTFKSIPLREGDKANFATLKEAALAGDLALVSSKRKSDGSDVALVCAMGWDGTHFLPTPVAVMIEGNPFELFTDPSEELAEPAGTEGGEPDGVSIRE